MLPAGSGQTTKETETTDSTHTGHGWRVTLFNCDCHTFDQVERQLIKAVRCSIAQARAWSDEVHNRGAAVVYEGPQERCEAVAAVLEDIRLKVRVSQ